MKKQHYVIIGSALVAVLVISIALVQITKINKEYDLKQQSINIQKQELEYQKKQDEKKEEGELFDKMILNACLQDAEDTYWNYMEINGTGDRYDGVKALTRYWDTAKKDKEKNIDNCYRNYNK
jgi:hypothetical protein